jgi:hypothetical protein
MWKLPWHSLFCLSPNGIGVINRSWRSTLWDKLAPRGTLGRPAGRIHGRSATTFGQTALVSSDSLSLGL